MCRIRDTEGVWPVAVKVDALSYADCSVSPAAIGDAIGVLTEGEWRLGRYTHDATHTTEQWLARMAPKPRRAR